MENENRRPKPRNHKKKRRNSKAVIILASIAILLLVLIIAMMLMVVARKDKAPAETAAPVVTTGAVESTAGTTAATEETTEATTVPPETKPEMLAEMADLYAQNPDVAGWVLIDGTKLDYPVMYTPEDEEKYLHADFEGKFSVQGLPLIDKDCKLDPESQNIIIYGHNMNNGTAFRALMGYDTKTFYEQHPTFEFHTLYEERTYEIVAAFYDRVYMKTDNCFKFYNFIEPADEAEFNEAMTYFKEHSLYDTGVTAEYGDSLVTLVTCAYHVDNGRFVVVGRQVTETDEADE